MPVLLLFIELYYLIYGVDEMNVYYYYSDFTDKETQTQKWAFFSHGIKAVRQGVSLNGFFCFILLILSMMQYCRSRVSTTLPLSHFLLPPIISPYIITVSILGMKMHLVSQTCGCCSPTKVSTQIPPQSWFFCMSVGHSLKWPSSSPDICQHSTMDKPCQTCLTALASVCAVEQKKMLPSPAPVSMWAGVLG